MNFAFNLLTVGCVFLFSSLGHAQNVHGILKVVKGDVQIKAAKNGQMVKARIGEQVFPKDIVITGKEARAKIVMVDNNEINVSPDSQVEIQHYEFDPAQGKKDVLLNVIYGKVRSKVEQHYDGKTSKFEVKTPAAVAGVRGTDFLMGFDRKSGESQVVTFRGAVAFGVPGPNGTISNAVSVTPGKVATSTGGVAPQPPTDVPKNQLAKMDNDSKADGSTGPTKNGPAPASDKPSDKKGDGANNSPPTPSPSTRAPSSVTVPSLGGSMLQAQDLPSNVPPAPPVALPAVPVAPPVAPVAAPTQCTTCNQITQTTNKNTALTVQIK